MAPDVVPAPRDAAAAAIRSARRERVEALFAAAVDLPAIEREPMLARAAVDEPDIAAEVRGLLAVAGDDASLQATIAAAIDALAHDAPARLLGHRVGAYRLVELIGEGGMGTVYLAERADSTYRQRVAIKLLRAGLGSSAAVARFRDERQLLARLDHPAIVRLLDGGSTDTGLPFLVMEHVDGVPVTTHARHLPVRGKVELMRAICGAVQHAHQQLVVHRDLKPANVLVDRTGAPKLLDFGIAKLLAEDAAREAKTRTGMPLLTAEYASPEQARGDAVTVASDVYSLGAMFYELLVGAPPQRAQASMLATLRVICEVEPARPSVAAPAAVRGELVGDLDNIVMKALEKAPAARYGSVAALADDLDRWLRGLPVTARTATFAYRAGKYVRRNRTALALAALVAGALATATIVSLGQARRAAAQRRVAEAQTAVAEARTRSLLIEQALQELRAERASRALPYLAEVLRQGEDTPAIRFLLAEALRPLELEVAAPITVPEGLVAAVWSPDGATVALGGWGGVVLLADRDLHVRARLASGADLPAYHPSFTPDSRALVAVVQATVHQPARAGESRVRVWDVATGALRHSWPSPDPWVRWIAIGDRTVAVAGDSGGAAVWDLATGEERLRVAPGPGGRSRVALAGGDRWLVLAHLDGGLEWRDVATLGVVGRWAGTGTAVSWLVQAPDGRLVGGWVDGTVRIFDDASGHARVTFDAGGAWPTVAPGPTALATLVGGDSTWRLWDRDGHGRGAIAGSPRGVRAIRWSADGARLAFAGDDTFQIWDATTGARTLLVEAFAAAGDAPHAVGGALDASFSPDGTRLLTTSGTEARLWTVSAAPIEQDLRMPFNLWAARWSPDERTLAVGGFEAGLFDAATGARRATLDAGTPRLSDVAWSHDGARVAMVGYDGAAVVFAADGRKLRALVGHRGPVNSVAWSPDDRTIATAGSDGAAILWDADTGARRATLAHPGGVASVSWSRDGARLVTAGAPRTLRVWDVATGAVVRALPDGHTQYLHAAFSPDGTRLASGGHDGEVSVWHLATGARTSLDGHTGPATYVEWSPDGALLATAGDDGTVRVWDPVRGSQLAVRAFPGTNLGVQWSRDGTRLLGASHGSGVRVWTVAGDRRTSAELDAVTRARSPWRLAGTRLVRAR